MSPQLTATSALLTGVLAVGQHAPLSYSQEVNPDAFTSAEVCGECHQAIHAVWQHSMHARAFTNGIFQAAYREVKQSSERRSRVCLSCHAPTVRKSQDYAAQEPITRQGVTCDFCHSIRDVDLDGPVARPDLHVGQTKYGPLKHAQSPAHEVVDSDLHRRSELCATCHEYRNQHGVAILETYSEWKASPYAEAGVHCQDCHMPLVPGRVVVPGLTAPGRKDPPRDAVNLHNISGSHDLEQVRKAATMKILGAVRLGENMVGVRISVANVGSGHCFPTGLPLRRVILEVRLTDRGLLLDRRTIEFAKVLTQARGAPITREGEAFLDARAIERDTRLKPKEDRTVSLTFYNVQASKPQVEARLSYQYSTRTVWSQDGVEATKPVEMKILLASDSHRVLGPRR